MAIYSVVAMGYPANIGPVGARYDCNCTTATHGPEWAYRYQFNRYIPRGAFS